MRTGFPAHIHAAAVGDAVILLDARADRYHRLDSSAAAAIHALAGPSPTCETNSDQLHDLIALGILSVGAERLKIFDTGEPAIRSALESADEPADSRQLQMACALIAARLGLRIAGLERSLAWLRRRPVVRTSAAPVTLGAFARGLERDRPFAPLRRHCLPDAVAAVLLARKSGLACQLVIGVRDNPFAAHAWAQSGSTVVNDALGNVADLVPILRA